MTQTVIPQLRMTNAESSLAFYVEALGFSIDWKHQFEPGFPLFVQLTRNGQTIFLSEHAGDCQVGGAIYFLVPDADACYTAFVAKGASVSDRPEDTAWGTREFVVIDPDGNRLRFASRVSDQVTAPEC